MSMNDNRRDLTLQPGAAVYGENGKFLGAYVAALADPLLPETALHDLVAGKPYGYAIAPYRSTAALAQRLAVYGERRVWSRDFGSVKQWLVKAIGGPCWINVRDDAHFA